VVGHVFARRSRRSGRGSKSWRVVRGEQRTPEGQRRAFFEGMLHGGAGREIGLSVEVAPAHATLKCAMRSDARPSKQGAERERKLAWPCGVELCLP
jgi:hypothetical protein